MAAIPPAVLQVKDGQQNLLVAAATGQLMVYSQNRLMWAAKGDAIPVAIKVATFADLAGLVLTLDDAGQSMLKHADHVLWIIMLVQKSACHANKLPLN